METINENVLKYLPLAILIVKPDDLRLTFANNSAIKLFNGEHNNLLDYTLADFAVLSKDELLDKINAAKKEKVEIRFKRRNQTGFTGLVSAIHLPPSLFNTGDAIILLIEDITAYVQTIDSQQAKLRENIRQLNEANISLKSFNKVIAHDLRTPLRSINMFATQLLNKGEGAILTGSDIQNLQLINRAVKNMDELIQGLLRFSELGLQRQTFEPVDLNELIDEILLEYSEQIERHKPAIHVAALPVVHTDKTLLKTICSNLISNAIKYSSREVKPEIWIKARIEDKKLILSIKDNGIGIDPKHHQQVFELFERLHSQEEFEGKGIGLGIVSRIVSLLNGSITIESERGKGCDVILTLPLNPEKTETLNPSSANKTPEN